MNYSRAVQWHTPIITLLAAFLGKNASNDIATTSKKCASTELQRFLGLHLQLSDRNAAVLTHNRTIGCLYGQKG
jgi:hypothetical protein